MPSTHKTPFLRLNQWLGSDKPKRDDFNSDNLTLDARLRSHFEDLAAHITPEERSAWNDGIFTVGSYIGNGVCLTRDITLGYQPRVIFLYTLGRALLEPKASLDTTNLYSAVYTPLGASQGLEILPDGFKVYNNSNSVTSGCTCLLNLKDRTYIYLVIR